MTSPYQPGAEPPTPSRYPPYPPPAPPPGARRPLSSGVIVALALLGTFGALATAGFALFGFFLVFGADSCTTGTSSTCGDTIGPAITLNLVGQGVLFLVAVIVPFLRPIRPGIRIAVVAAVLPLSLGTLIAAFAYAASSVPSTS
ncbi:MAG: hypothetical protein R2726_14260 [Acidimicrobiales bacterium]